ncbi:prolipoprotein diacylglyceryl transferase [Telmatobacter sp. DSM 110680]|uniref:Prolipoprotein diacylglyceryl transferase n=1 Tax=Telmatobacter sp. DSM 110680 TaxID=3036704 RepID=A0AAU7DRR9_9BACT
MHPVLFHIGSLVIPSYGAIAAVGVLLALMLALHTARKLKLDPNKIWNLSILMLFTALLGSRLLLVIANWTVLRHHPLWLLSLAMIHHPLLAAIGSFIALAVATVYVRKNHLPSRVVADALAAPAALALGGEQVGALLAGSGYGAGAHVPWAIVYTDALADRWSGAPLGIPVHPVQAYVALCFFAITLGLILCLPRRRQNGDLAGLFLMATGVVLFITEFWRDPIGRGAMLGGFLKGPQAAAILLVLVGAFILWDSPSQQLGVSVPSIHPAPSAHSAIERPSHG